jgi:hypothetical protein
LLKSAIAALRQLPEQRQEAIARAIIDYCTQESERDA